MYVIVLLAPPLLTSAFASVFLIISILSGFFDFISITPLISTSGAGILLLASSIARFISCDRSILWMASSPFRDTASKASYKYSYF